MRTIVTSALLLNLAFSLAAQSAETAATTAQVEEALGSNLAAAVAKFGVPKDLASCPSCREGVERFQPFPQSDDCVQFGYGPFGLLLQESSVRGCVFLPGWKEAVHGVKLGDSQADVVKLLGDKFQEKSKPDSRPVAGAKAGDPHSFYSWELSEGRQLLWVYWSKDKTVDRIEVWSRPPAALKPGS